MSCPIICEISTKNLIANANAVRTLVQKRKVYAVVKADAYGHGLVGVSNALYNVVDGFCVSLAREALDLRIAGIDKEILLLIPAVKEDLERLISHNVTLTVCSKIDLLSVIDVCSKLKKQAFIHVKLNTGMNRLGLDSVNALSEILTIASKSQFIEISGAFSHLGNPADKKYSKRQLENFKNLSTYIKNYNPNATLHLSASGGIALGKDYLFDAVRVGIMLYGYCPNKFYKNLFKPVMKVYAKTVCVRDNLNGENLLYGSKKYYKKSVTLIRLGYADGFFRKGCKAEPPLCMDISAVDGKFLSDYVLVMDNAQTLAKKHRTIVYEILTSCSKRAKIIYI